MTCRIAKVAGEATDADLVEVREFEMPSYPICQSCEEESDDDSGWCSQCEQFADGRLVDGWTVTVRELPDGRWSAAA